jgi:protocatechuate 3,4-dioxygenase beta subunit
MSNQRSLVTAVLLLLAAAATIWIVSRGDKVEPPAPSSAAAEAGQPLEAAGVAPAAGAAVPAGIDAPTTRIEAAAAAAPGDGPSLSGQVVDDAGQPVAAAAVRASRGMAFDGQDFEEELVAALAAEPEAAMARVRAAREDGATTTTDADGRFRLPMPQAGRGIWLRIEARGHRVLDRNLARPATGDLDVGVLRLERGAIVSGRVVDRAGNGIAGARVVREPAGMRREWMGAADLDFPGMDTMPDFGGERALTDDEGRFELLHAGAGEFALRARHPDHPSARQEGLSVAVGALLRDVLLVLEPGASIRGRVVGVPADTKALRVAVMSRRDAPPAAAAEGDEGPFAAFAGAGEQWLGELGGFGERTAAVAADGSFEARGLRAGQTYRVWVTQSGRGMLGNTACSQRLEVTTPSDGIELRYDVGITVTFQVVADVDGAPIERLWVEHSLRGGGGVEELMGQALGRGGRAATYASGRVTIANLRPQAQQTLSLAIQAVGCRPFERKDIALPRSGPLDLGTIRLAPAPVLRVQVVSKADAAPVAGATVRVRAAASESPRGGPLTVFTDRMASAGAQSARTDADGRCIVNAPPGESIVVVVSSKEHARHESAPFVLPAAGGDYEAVLLRGGRVEVTVVDADGAVAKALRVEHLGPDGARDSRTSNDLGLAQFDRLPPGEHRFRLGDAAPGAEFVAIAMEAAGGGDAADEAGWQTVEVADGGTAALRLAKAASAQLRGIVRENGLPLADARIGFLSGAEGDARGELVEMMAGFGRGGGGSGRSARTAADGSYQLRDLPAGTHRLRVTARSRTMPAVVVVQLRAGENQFDVDLEVALVRGVVRGADGQPLAGATVRVGPARDSARDQDPMAIVADVMPGGVEMLAGATGGRSTKTDAEGRYELRGVQAGVRLQVHAAAKGWAATTSAPLEVAPGGVLDGIDLQLLRAGRIQVTSAVKTPFLVAQARLLGPGGEVDDAVAPVVQMLANGKGTLDGLRAGRWRVSLQSPSGDAPPSQEVEVTAGATAVVAF